MGRAKKKSDPFAQRPGETWLQWQSRLARQRDLAEAAKQPLVSKEAEAHGDYQDGYTEVDGLRRAVKINRGGSTIQRWLNQRPCNILGDSERAAIRYCQMLWARLDYKCPAIVFVDNGRDGMGEHEALAELGQFKIRLPRRYWDHFENVCRFEHPAEDRHSKVTVGFVAGMIAMWRGL
jgi:hypothetical protein